MRFGGLLLVLLVGCGAPAIPPAETVQPFTWDGRWEFRDCREQVCARISVRIKGSRAVVVRTIPDVSRQEWQETAHVSGQIVAIESGIVGVPGVENLIVLRRGQGEIVLQFGYLPSFTGESELRALP